MSETPTPTTNLADLAQAVESLNSESDDLNSTIEALNAKLRTLNVGVEAWAKGSNRDEPTREYGYDNYDGSWQLCTRREIGERDLLYGSSYHPSQVGDLEYKPLLKCSRAMRIEGLALVPQIVRELHTQVEGSVAAIRAAKELAAAL